MSLDAFITYLANSFNLFLENELFFLVGLGLLALLAFIAGLFILRAILHGHTKTSRAFHKTILLIRVPKEKKNERQDNQGGNEDNINHTREQIAIAEAFFSSIAGLKPDHGFFKWLLGRNEHIAFEIEAKDGKISFYAVVPDKLRSLLEQQIHAQYPHAEISVENDYNIFKPDSHIVGSYLWFKHKSIFPFKTYKKMDSDPLVAILNPLSKILDSEGAVVQFIVRPAGHHWRRHGVHIVRDIREGQKFEYVAQRGWLTRGLYKWKKIILPKHHDPAKNKRL